MRRRWILSAALFLLPAALQAQTAPATGQGTQPTYSVSMVPKTILAINYQNRRKTDIEFRGSPLMPLAKGTATVDNKDGRTAIAAEFKELDNVGKFGPEYLTYVLWAITPEGKANNLGEILVSGGKSKIQVTTTLQTFGLIVTAEPYYAVADPSDVVVLENVTAPATSGTLQQVTVNYHLFKRGVYSYDTSILPPSSQNSKVPIELQEARNAVQIARHAGAQQYAPDTLGKAQQSLSDAEALLKKGDRRVIVQDSRDAVQTAAEAVQMTMQRQDEERLAKERADAAQRTAEAQAAAEAASAQQQQEALARQKAELEQKQAELQAQQAAQAREAAELKAQQDAQAAAQAQQQAAQAQQQAAQAEQAQAQAQQAAQQAEQAAQQSELEKQQLRATLLEQFNRVLPTTDTPRGLKANLADVLFATGKYDLEPTAREALAKFSGIVLAHPGLKMQVEGYTDSTGSDTYNQSLSENRANAVRAYLIGQGLGPDAVTAAGFGKSNPVASNDTAAGRKQNRRVEIIISGEIIGTQIGGSGAAQNQPQP